MVVLAVGGEIEGGVVHILRTAVHLFPEGDLELLGTAVGGAAAVNAQQAAGHGEVFGLAAPDAVEHDVQRPVGPGCAVFGRGIGNAIDHQRVRAEHGPLGGVILLHLVGRAEHLLGNALAAGQDDNGQHSCQRKGKDSFCFTHVFSILKNSR